MGIEQLSDPGRIAALRKSGLIGSPGEEQFDAIARLAAHLLGAPVSLISLITEDKSFFKSCVGIPDDVAVQGDMVPLSHSICQYTVRSGKSVIVDDAREDPELNTNGAVTDLGVIAYAGIPLAGPEGHVFGTLCAIEMQPRKWTERDIRILRDLADAVTAQILLRVEIRERARIEEELRTTESRLRNVLSSAQAVVFTLSAADGALKATWVSENIRRLFGYEPADTLHDGWWKSKLHPEDAGRVIRDMPRNAESAIALEYRIQDADGNWRWIFDDRRRVRQHQNGAWEIVGTWTDITEQKAAEQENRAEFIRLMLERGSELVTLLDAGGAIMYVSPSIERVFGYPPESVAAHSLFEFVHPEDVKSVSEKLHTVTAGAAREMSLEFRFRHKSGSYRTVVAAGKNLLADPQVRGIVVNSLDVTEHRKLEAEYNQAQKMDAIGRLASGVAHDFNNVLSVILGGTGLLLESLAGDDPLRPEVSEIHQCAQRGSELTRHLLLFSRKQVVQPRVIEPVVVITGFEQFIRRLIGNNVELQLITNASAGRVSIDPGQLEQVLLNLCVNARDAMPDGGSLTITCKAATEPGWTVIEVRDTGAGMSSAVRERIFEPFFTTKAEGKGTGLGLATVYGIVTKADGRLEVDSVAGTGTTFRVLLPNARDEPAVEIPTATISSIVSRSGARVLLVDDDTGVRSIMRRILLRAQYEVADASSAADALQLISAQYKFDILVTDLRLPGMSGLDLAREVSRVYPDVRVVFVSGGGRDDLPADSVAEHTHFLQKPFEAAALLAIVSEALA